MIFDIACFKGRINGSHLAFGIGSELLSYRRCLWDSADEAVDNYERHCWLITTETSSLIKTCISLLHRSSILLVAH
jgi:hypothetical protein